MSLKETLKELQKKFGTEAIFQMGDEPTKIEVIPTGSIILNKALGIGGYPKGRITEIYGPESSGKTTLILHAIAESQKMNGAAAFIDAEHALDTKYAKNIGVKIENLIISQPDFGEQALDIVDELIRSNDIDIIVVDSVAALVPRAELEGDMGQSHMGLQARLMSQALRKITGILSKTNTVLIFTNQIRSKIGIVYGNPETTTGGNALKFYASIRLDIRRRNKIEKEDKIVGNDIEIKVVKNRLAAPFQEAKTRIMYGVGLYQLGELLDYHIDIGNIHKAGAWFKYKDQNIQGVDNMILYIQEHIEEFKI